MKFRVHWIAIMLVAIATLWLAPQSRAQFQESHDQIAFSRADEVVKYLHAQGLVDLGRALEALVTDQSQELVVSLWQEGVVDDDTALFADAASATEPLPAQWRWSANKVGLWWYGTWEYTPPEPGGGGGATISVNLLTDKVALK